ncbi:MAG: copper chaperone PCu(A)C [Novosphingobium sp.]
MLELVSAILKGLGYAAAFSGAGAVLAGTTLRAGAHSVPGVSGLIRFAGCALAICAVLMAAIYVARLGGDLDVAMIRAMVLSPLGAALGLQLGGGLLLAAAPARPSAFLGAVAILLAFGFIGHAPTRGLVSALTVTMHVSAAAWWLGGLWLLVLAGRLPGGRFAPLLESFSRQAIWLVALLVLAGLTTAAMLLEFRPDLGRAYDQGLLAKAAITLGLLALAATNRLVLVPRIAKDDTAIGKLRWTVWAEICLFACIFVVTAWLTTWQSPHAVVHGDHDVQVAGPITIIDPWAPAMPGGLGTGAGYMVIINNQASDDRLLSASSPWAEHVSLHVSTMDGNISRMSDLDTLPVPAHGQAEFAQGHNHLMFTGLYAPFVVGDVVPVTLQFERAGKVQVTLHVKPLGDVATGSHTH